MLTEKDIELIQQSFQKHAGALAFKELVAPSVLDPVAVLLMQKAASTDQKLFKIALDLAPSDPFAMYEKLGGQYSNEAQK